MGESRRRGKARWGADAAVVAVLALAAMGAQVRLDDPPRYDGAGYAVLARSLATGRGYREIDNPEHPRHAHFPPGYPLALAAVWSAFGESVALAHGFSFACSVGATVVFWAIFRVSYPRRVAAVLAGALALNWAWDRMGGAIRSEPLYELLGGLVILLVVRGDRSGVGERPRSDFERTAPPPRPSPTRGEGGRGNDRRALSSSFPPCGGGPGWGVWRVGGANFAIVLGALLGAILLTRHVGVCLAFAILIHLAIGRRGKTALIAALMMGLILLPWACWIVSVGRNTQAGLLPGTSLSKTVAGNALFYLRRLPDLLVGPVIEVGTVFRPSWSLPATIMAGLGSTIVLVGWLGVLRHKRRRLLALAGISTLALLLVWPFTEAGRFLVPLTPMVLLGAVEGLAWLSRPIPLRNRRLWIAGAVLLASIPYSAYALLSDRAGAAGRTHAPFDAACRFIADDREHPGPILARHPGEVYWLTGREALAPASEDPERIADQIDRYGIAGILVDEGRYANAPDTPLARFMASQPGLFQHGWLSDESTGDRVSVWWRASHATPVRPMH